MSIDVQRKETASVFTLPLVYFYSHIIYGGNTNKRKEHRNDEGRKKNKMCIKTLLSLC